MKNNRQRTIVQLTVFLILIVSTIGMIAFTDVYSGIKSSIVDKTCLSCIGMDPVTSKIFDPLEQNSEFVIENLSKGPVFIAYRDIVCSSCDDLEPKIKEILDVEFGEKETYFDIINYSGSPICFLHINLGVENEGPLYDSFYLYDKDKRNVVPMMVMITLGKEGDSVKPHYLTAYGDKPKDFIVNDIIIPAIKNYNKYKEEYINNLNSNT